VSAGGAGIESLGSTIGRFGEFMKIYLSA